MIEASLGSWAFIAAVALVGVFLLAVAVGSLLYLAITYSIWLVERKESGRSPKGAGEVLLLNATILSELWASVLMTLLQPIGFFDPLPARDRRSRPTGRPILLVHGHYQCWTNFVLLGPRLAAAGLGPIYVINMRPWRASIRHHAKTISDRIDEILHANGATEIDVVAHSMGGIAARVAEEDRNGRRRRIRRLVTLGSPHRGTKLGHVPLGEASREMAIDSPLIARLRTPPPGMLVSISSEHDAMMVPPENAQVGDHGRDIVVRHVGHLGLLLDREVFGEVHKALAEDVRSGSEVLAGHLGLAGAEVPPRG